MIISNQSNTASSNQTIRFHQCITFYRNIEIMKNLRNPNRLKKIPIAKLKELIIENCVRIKDYNFIFQKILNYLSFAKSNE